MIDYSKLSKIVDGEQTAKKPVKSTKPVKKVVDSKSGSKKDVPTRKPKVTDAAAEKKAIKDSLEKRRAARKYATFKVTDAFKDAKKRIKDELENTESTDDAVAVAVQALNEVPAEQAIAAVVEVLGEAIDILQGQCSDGNCDSEGDGIAEEGAEPAEVAEPDAEEDEEIKDSVNVTVTNEQGESVTVEAEGGDSVVGAELPTEPIITEGSINENVPVEGIGEEPMSEEHVGDSLAEGATELHENDTFKKIQDLIKSGKSDEALKLLNENAQFLNDIMGAK